jgi:hypothetical protein
MAGSWCGGGEGAAARLAAWKALCRAGTSPGRDSAGCGACMREVGAASRDYQSACARSAPWTVERARSGRVKLPVPGSMTSGESRPHS